jgi:hypothetical protein
LKNPQRIELRWEQVHSWRLAQHSLAPRLASAQLLPVVARLGGIHAQLTSAAELSLAARLEGLPPAAVENALWRERTLVKTWAMRGTLHLLAAADLPLYVAARAALPIRRPPSYFTYHGLTPAEFDAIGEHAPQVLSATPITREALAAAVAQAAGMPNLRDVLLSGWGALLKPLAFRGELCFGPNQGQNVTFVRPAAWLGGWPGASVPDEPYAALQAVARRYLTAYGPATPEDFARWWGTDAGPAKKLFRSLGEELASVVIEGWPAWALAAHVDPLRALAGPRSVRLLPQFDAYVVGLPRDQAALLLPLYKSRVHRPQGWISAVVLIDGRIAGVWEHERRRGKVTVKVSLFAPPDSEQEQALAAEAARLGAQQGEEWEVVSG